MPQCTKSDPVANIGRTRVHPHYSCLTVLNWWLEFTFICFSLFVCCLLQHGERKWKRYCGRNQLCKEALWQADIIFCHKRRFVNCHVVAKFSLYKSINTKINYICSSMWTNPLPAESESFVGLISCFLLQLLATGEKMLSKDR